MRNGLVIVGLSLLIIFGGGFLIRLIREGNFYIAEFIGGILGVILLLASMFLVKTKGSQL